MRLSDTGLTVLRDAEFDDLGLLPNRPGVLGFLKDHRLTAMLDGPVIIGSDDSYPDYDLGPRWSERYLGDLELIATNRYPFGAAQADDPEDSFWNLHEQLVREGFYPRRENDIATSARIHPKASVGEWSVGIHRGKGFITNAGYVRIGERVTIGAHTAVDRSVFKVPTSIGDDTQIDNLVHVAHNVQIGKRCTIIAGTVLGGSCVIGDDVFVGIGAHVRPGVHIGDGAFIGMSVAVLDDVAPGARLTCRSS